jgi:hypothetical protein
MKTGERRVGLGLGDEGDLKGRHQRREDERNSHQSVPERQLLRLARVKEPAAAALEAALTHHERRAWRWAC